MTRVAIVSGRLATSGTLKRALATLQGHEVAWIARDGHEALEQAQQDRPDVVLIESDLPGMGGPTCTRELLKRVSCQVLIVAPMGQSGYDHVFASMEAGAADVVELPRVDAAGNLHGLDAFSTRMLKAQARSFRSAPPTSGVHRIEAMRTPPPAPSPIAALAGETKEASHLVVIGSSTGGPQALVSLLSHFNTGVRPAVVIVQHLDVHFASGLAEWLTAESGFPVRIAIEGERVAAGQAYLAGTNDHLRMDSNGRLRYESEPLDYPYRPSVDVFFESLAAVPGKSGVAVLLTGMGRDGAQGLLTLRKNGWHTVAQDEATSAVYGMPKAAAAIGAAVQVLPLPAIAPAVLGRMRQRGAP
jgi:two-component system response regulator WspF